MPEYVGHVVDMEDGTYKHWIDLGEPIRRCHSCRFFEPVGSLYTFPPNNGFCTLHGDANVSLVDFCSMGEARER